CIGLELDAFLEVDQVKLDLVRPVMQCEIGNESVQQCGLARPRLTGDQRMLGSSETEMEVLPFGGAGPSERHAQAAAAVGRPPLLARRLDESEIDFDLARQFRLFTDV